MSTLETESEESSPISNDNLSVTVTKAPHCQIKFDVVVTPPSVAAAYHKAIKNVNKDVNIPGFRKGKAPDKLITEKYSSAIQKEFVDLVLQIGFNDAIHLTHIHPLKDGRIQRPLVLECSLEKGAHFIIEFEARPVIPTVNLDDLQLKKINPTPITEQEQQNALQNLLLQFANYEPVNDRPVEENDFIDISVFILEEPPREVIHNQRTHVIPTGLPLWLRQKVVGLNVGESAEGMTEQDPNLSEPTSNFEPLPFRATVNAIWNGNLPTVDDELAKRVGLQTVDELQKKLKERLEQEAEEEAYKAEVQALEDALVEKHPVDLPQSYIDNNKEVRLKDYLLQLEKENRDYTKEDYKQIEKMIEQSTIYHLQIFFLLRKVAADYKISIADEDLTKELTRQVALMSSGRSSVDFSGNRDKFREQLQNLALDRKIKQYLLDHAKLGE